MPNEVAIGKMRRLKRRPLWLALGVGVVAIASCATATQVVAPPLATPRQGSAVVEVEVLDRRPEPLERDALEVALRPGRSRCSHPAAERNVGPTNSTR